MMLLNTKVAYTARNMHVYSSIWYSYVCQVEFQMIVNWENLKKSLQEKYQANTVKNC